jgi:hypothetical protein
MAREGTYVISTTIRVNGLVNKFCALCPKTSHAAKRPALQPTQPIGGNPRRMPSPRAPGPVGAWGHCARDQPRARRDQPRETGFGGSCLEATLEATLETALEATVRVWTWSLAGICAEGCANMSSVSRRPAGGTRQERARRMTRAGGPRDMVKGPVKGGRHGEWQGGWTSSVTLRWVADASTPGFMSRRVGGLAILPGAVGARATCMPATMPTHARAVASAGW